MSMLRYTALLLVTLVARPTEAEEPAFVLENDTCRWAVAADGTVQYFGTPDGQHNVCEPGQTCMQVLVDGQVHGASTVRPDQSSYRVEFGASGVTAWVKAEAKADYLALTVTDVQGSEFQWLQFVNLRLTITRHVGTLINAAWDDQYAACALACNDQTESFGADSAKGYLCVRCYPEFGCVGARAALIGLPTGVPEPDRTLLAAIGRVELAEGLPHPLLDGTWIKESPGRFRSYLMVHDLGEDNVDEIIRVARSGFGCIEFYPWRATPSYEINPALFPHGLAGLQAVCDKIHAAGMQVGLHVMQGMVGWGAKDDPYIAPRADARLLQDRQGTLAADIDAQTTTLALSEPPTDWPDQGDLYVDGEIIGYAKRGDAGFTECQRGLHGTTATAHPAGTPVGHLVNCFPIWGHTVYCPDIHTDLPDEICTRLAEVFNAVGADMSYLDGGEELVAQQPHWRSVGTFALGLQKRLQKPAFLGGNACYTHMSWHVITRGSPHYDPIHFGRREYTLRFKGVNPAGHAKNLLVGDVGWFAPHPHSLTADAVTPDEVLLLCLKALGGKAPISFSVSAGNLWKNERLPEMLDIIRACDELKQREYFSPAALAELARPRAEFDLEQQADGQWDLRPLQFGPAATVNAAAPERANWDYANPYEAQTPFVRIRARNRLAPYGDPGNVVLVDPAQGNPFQTAGTASDSVTQEVQLASETTPDGGAAVCYRAANNSETPSSWTKIAAQLPAAVDISGHRRLGLWIKSNGSGGILNVQLTRTDARRDHYIPLTFTGWRYVELDTPEDTRFWDYSWPLSWTDLFYTDWWVYNATHEVDLYFNGLPAHAEAECLIGRIEALRELPGPLCQPSLRVHETTLAFPVDLLPDHYVELDFAGRCRHFDPNGKVLAELTPQGSLALLTGSNPIRLTCGTEGECTTRAEVTLSVRGAPLADARRAGDASPTDRYPSLGARQ
ncbi:MAG: hypothetical protein GXY58_18125 [Planctomycetaceae bacterium]|nr:hypothetical protein [Planctomycetaceae bacterium]